MSVAQLVTCQTETSAREPLRQTLVSVKSIEMLIVFGINVRFLKRYFSKIELVQLLAKMTRFWRFFMRKFCFPPKIKLPPPKIDFHPAFGTFLLFYSTIFSTDFTVDFLNLYSLVKDFYIRDGISPLVVVSYPLTLLSISSIS